MLDNNAYCRLCSKCCYGTEMILVHSDIKRLEERGFKGFYSFNNGFFRLLNVDGHCIFLNTDTKSCSIYLDRPLGCRVYPLIYDEGYGVMIDTLCPYRAQISCSEILNGIKELSEFLSELEKTYYYRVDWNLFRASVNNLIKQCR